MLMCFLQECCSFDSLEAQGTLGIHYERSGTRTTLKSNAKNGRKTRTLRTLRTPRIQGTLGRI